jgi:hypothetical protein
LATEFDLKRVAFDLHTRTAHANLDMQGVLKNFYVLIMLSQKVAKKPWVMKLEKVDANFGHHVGH